ncbi:hypothetical protein [Roseomonas chloroacetimidivorans]|uniref:hypothetical protein n=1 Tax=Roseomonas chloroacetimidivorans TaxID=1766656 RepID=UPI003C78E5A2
MPILSLGERRRPPELAPVAELRALRERLEVLVTNTIDMLDALDGDYDLEPDAEGEAEKVSHGATPLPGGQQPVTLVPDWVRPVQVLRPGHREMREAYRRNGDPIPANLRFDIFGRPRG